MYVLLIPCKVINNQQYTQAKYIFMNVQLPCLYIFMNVQLPCLYIFMNVQLLYLHIFMNVQISSQLSYIMISNKVTVELPLGDLVKHVVEDAVVKNR